MGNWRKALSRFIRGEKGDLIEVAVLVESDEPSSDEPIEITEPFTLPEGTAIALGFDVAPDAPLDAVIALPVLPVETSVPLPKKKTAPRKASIKRAVKKPTKKKKR